VGCTWNSATEDSGKPDPVSPLACEVPIDDLPPEALQDRWWTFGARNNMPRIGRVLMARGRDAADVAITTAFGTAWMKNFTVASGVVADAKAATTQ
jgi:hypothetical protein